jgi:hypothetical protein
MFQLSTEFGRGRHAHAHAGCRSFGGPQHRGGAFVEFLMRLQAVKTDKVRSWSPLCLCKFYPLWSFILWYQTSFTVLTTSHFYFRTHPNLVSAFVYTDFQMSSVHTGVLGLLKFQKKNLMLTPFCYPQCAVPLTICFFSLSLITFLHFRSFGLPTIGCCSKQGLGFAICACVLTTGKELD